MDLIRCHFCGTPKQYFYHDRCPRCSPPLCTAYAIIHRGKDPREAEDFLADRCIIEAPMRTRWFMDISPALKDAVRKICEFNNESDRIPSDT